MVDIYKILKNTVKKGTVKIGTKETNRIRSILNSDNVPSFMAPSYGIWDESNVSVSLIVYLVAVVVFGIMAGACFYTGITHVVVPEWYAIQEILGLL